ncbi:hypothetical protein Rhal01_02958 [Rubritalea halochordaticola]|uniref:DUF58 domain-containing protein n=1 Tax=Rubritalea halochordaticola TaxID=714537 RepID=A0ABP9V262_9BACT
MAKQQSFTDPSFIRRLESLYLIARRVLGGTLQADRKSTRKGTGITFADYSEYNFGDDYRAIDWRVYARTEELVIKLFEMEEDATIYLLLDCSRSMESKFLQARQLAAALGYIGLNCLDRLAIYGMADKLVPLLDPSRGRGAVLPFLRSLEDAETFGNDTDFTACVKSLQARHRKKGMVLVVSDFLFPTGFHKGLQLLQGLKHDVYCLQVHDTADLECSLKGDVELECVESGTRHKVTITPKEAKAYQEAIARWNDELKTECKKRGLDYLFTTNGDNFEDTVTHIIRKGGLAG